MLPRLRSTLSSTSATKAQALIELLLQHFRIYIRPALTPSFSGVPGTESCLVCTSVCERAQPGTNPTHTLTRYQELPHEIPMRSSTTSRSLSGAPRHHRRAFAGVLCRTYSYAADPRRIIHQHRRLDTHPAAVSVLGRASKAHKRTPSPTTCCQKRKLFRGTRNRAFGDKTRTRFLVALETSREFSPCCTPPLVNLHLVSGPVRSPLWLCKSVMRKRRWWTRNEFLCGVCGQPVACVRHVTAAATV